MRNLIFPQWTDELDGWALGELSGIGAGMAFGNFHVVLLVEVAPVVGDAACGVVERHGDGLEKGFPEAVDIGELDEFGAVDVVVVGQVETVVGASQVAAGILDGAFRIGFLHTTDNVVSFLSS